MVAPLFTAPREKVTAEEFLSGDETLQPRHLIDGDIFEMNSPLPIHQDIQMNIIALLLHLRMHGRLVAAPMDVEFDDYSVMQPDIFWISSSNAHCVNTGKRYQGAPDLIIEILSPSTASFDRKRKFKLYETHGVRELWLVDPEAGLVEVWHQVDGKFSRLDIYESGETFDSPSAGKVEVAPMFATSPTPPVQG